MPRGRKPKIASTEKITDIKKPVRIRSKKWCFTLNNYTEEEYQNIIHYITSNSEYGIVGKETAPTTNTKHLQGYVRFDKCLEFNTVKKIFANRTHIEKAIADDMKNRNYCSKENDFFEHGTPQASIQGKRNDLQILHESIKQGTRVKDIRQQYPDLYHQYGRTLEKLESDRLSDFIRTEMPNCIWYYGTTGTGKSYRALKNMTKNTHYLVPNDNGWWDCYAGQETIVFNDFRGGLPFSDLLQLCDRYNYYVKRRNRDPYPVSSKNIIITTALPPEKVYKNLDKEDSMAQLYRRFKVYQCIDWNTEIERTYSDWFDESIHSTRNINSRSEQDDPDAEY